MKKLFLLTLLLPVSLHPKVDFTRSFKTVKKHINALEKELTQFAKNNKPYEVRNLTTLIRTHINLMAAGTTATAPQYASQELEIKKHLNDASKKLFSHIRDTAQQLNPPTQLFGGSTISFEAETFLAGVITLLRSELSSKKNARILRQAQDERSGDAFSARPELVEGNKRKKLKKIHEEGRSYIKKNKKLLSEDDKKLLIHERGLIETYKKLHQAKAQKASTGPAGKDTLQLEINTAANREIELFNALSEDAKNLFRKIRKYAQQINSLDTFVGGLSPKVIAFLDDIKKKL